MRPILIIIGCVLLQLSAPAQNIFFQPVKKYFRVDPFAGAFSAFVNAVKTDPQLQNIRFQEKSDTGLFSIRGDYKKFNPFPLKASKVEIMLAEKTMRWQNERSRLDTIMLYQLSGFFENNPKTVKAIKKEFKKINWRLDTPLPGSRSFSLDKLNQVQEGVINNRYAISSIIAPISVAWYIDKESQNIILMLILRLKYENNRAIAAGDIRDHYQ